MSNIKIRYKTKINNSLFVYWLLILVGVIIVLSHIKENPYGLSGVVLVLLLPTIIRPLHYLQIDNIDLKFSKKYLFFYSVNKKFKLQEISKVEIEKYGKSAYGFGWIFHFNLNLSALTRFFTADSFYSSYAEVSIYNSKGIPERLKVNITHEEIDKVMSLLNKEKIEIDYLNNY